MTASDIRRWQWLAVILIAGFIVWSLAPILTPFVISALLGWLGDPLVDRLERSGRARSTSVVIVFVLITAVDRARPDRCRRSTNGSPNHPSMAEITNGVRIGARLQTNMPASKMTASHCQRRISDALIASLSASRRRRRAPNQGSVRHPR